MSRVVVVGAGFAGLNVAKRLGGAPGVEVVVVDRSNHHLFQPLLYQVAMAGLSPADIAAPIRSILSRHHNIRVLMADVTAVNLDRNRIVLDGSIEESFDYLVLACGAKHSYFGHDDWETNAPGLKTLEQATEIRRRVLSAYENAERATTDEERRRLLTFIVVGGGPTGVELAGAIGEMSRHTLARDFRRIDATSAHVVLVEAGPRILPMFSEQLAGRAVRDLAALGVEVRTGAPVTKIDRDGVDIAGQRLPAATVLWAAGVKASPLAKMAGMAVDGLGRALVEPDLSIKGHPNVFVAGDQAAFLHQTGKPLPGTAPAAMQQGIYLANLIRSDLAGKPRQPFQFVDKGQMATIGRGRAIVEIGEKKFAGHFAWLVWLVVHVYYLTGFKNRLLVVLQWAWSYLTFHRGARLIVPKEWRTDERREGRE